MSNGSSSCPPVTLPFGVFPAKETICPLEPGDFPGPDPPPCLEDFISANSPTDATALDGFDQYFQDTAAVVDALGAALDSLGADLIDSFAEADTIDPKPVADTAVGLAGAVDVSSKSVDDLGTLLSSTTQQAPGAGGGGGGGGGGTPTPSPCTGTLTFKSDNPVPYTQIVVFTNVNPVDITVKSKTLTDPRAGTFKVAEQIPATVKPGESHNIFITQEVQAQLGYKAKWEIVHTGADSPGILCFQIGTFNEGLPAPAGGAGGGPPLKSAPAQP